MTPEIREYLRWFLTIFEDVIITEGWNIFILNGDGIIGPLEMNDMVVKDGLASNTNIIYETSKISKEKVFNLAKEYGFVIDENGVIIDYNKDNINRNKHLIAVKELGLL